MQSIQIDDNDVWFETPSVLLTNITDVWPSAMRSSSLNNNAIARLIIAMTLIRTAINRSNTLNIVTQGCGLLIYLAIISNKKVIITSPVPALPESKLPPTADVNMGNLTEPSISDNDMNRMAIGTQCISQATFRPSENTLIYSTRPLTFKSKDKNVIVDNTVGVGKFVSRLM
jgi:hypothetical protein